MNFLKVLLVLGLLLGSSAVEEEDGRILGALSTITHLVYATSTTTVPVTCYTTISAAPCVGRRRRHIKLSGHHLARSYRAEEPIELSGTQSVNPTSDHDPVADVMSADEKYRKGRFAVTVWSSVTTTYTFTVTSTDTATTYSVSFLCSNAAAVFPNLCIP